MQVKSFAECSKGNFQPSLSYQLSFRFLFCRFLSGRLTQVLLYTNVRTFNSLFGSSTHNLCKQFGSSLNVGPDLDPNCLQRILQECSCFTEFIKQVEEKG